MKKQMHAVAAILLTVCMLLTMMPFSVMAAEDTKTTVLKADVLVHGRTYEKDGALQLDWTNSGISFNFTGTGAKMTITNSSMNPNPGYINVYVDGALTATKTIQLTATKAEYVLAEGLEDGPHTISVRKRNESVYGGSATVGLLDLTITGGALTAAPAKAERQIEVIGDSITAGFGNLDVGSKLGYNSHTSDGTSTYATLTAAAFGADIDVIARSGIRFIRVDPNGSMYPVYEQVSGLNGKCTDPYDFASNPKDVVIINLGTNDAGAGQTDEYVTSETVEFLKLVRKNNPNALIVWAYGIMGNGKTDAIQAGIKQVQEAGDDKLFFFALDKINSALENIGTGNHPTVVTAINRSFDLAEFIASKMNWDYDYDTQLAQMLKIAETYDSDYLSTYTNDSIKALTDAIAAAKALPATATNEQIKEAVAAIQVANRDLELALDEAAVLGEAEQTATGHFMRINYTVDNVDAAAWEGRPLYLQYEVKGSTTNRPANATWKNYVQNGRAWFGNDFNNRFVDGLNLANAEVTEPTAQSTEWMKVTLEIPTDKIPETISEVGFYYYNDTGNMSESDKAGVAWDNNSGVTLHIRNVRLMTTNLDMVVKSVLKTRLEARKSAGNLLSYTDDSVAAYNKLFDDAQAVYDDPDATQEEVNAASKSIKNAETVLKLKDENTIAIFFTEERTSTEAHYLSLDSVLDTALNLADYKGEELALLFDIRIDTTESFAGSAADNSWLTSVQNGKISLYTAANTGYTIANAKCGTGDFSGMVPNEWMSVKFVLPADLLKETNITKFHMFIYNDTAAAGFSNDTGITLSIRDLHISKTGNKLEVSDKDVLEDAITTAEKLTNLSVYTEATRDAFTKALADAKAVMAKEDATKDEIDAAALALNNAYDALELDTANVVATFLTDTKTSTESHYLSLDQALAEELKLDAYKYGDLALNFDICINTTDKHPDPDEATWLSFIRNGQVRLFSVPAAEANNENYIPLAGDTNNQVHCLKGVFETIQANKWLSVSIPVPEQLYTDGQITKFHMFLYNDMAAVGAGWSNDTGVTLSLRNLRIVKTEGGNVTPVVDKAALNAAITDAETITDLTVYTDDSAAAFTAALTNAKTVAANADATQEDVDAALSALTAAKEGLTEKPVVTVDYGNIDGSEDGVTAADALMALQAATGKVNLTDAEKAAADVDGEAGVSANDALVILQFATKKISSFPVEVK